MIKISGYIMNISEEDDIDEVLDEFVRIVESKGGTMGISLVIDKESSDFDANVEPLDKHKPL